MEAAAASHFSSNQEGYRIMPTTTEQEPELKADRRGANRRAVVDRRDEQPTEASPVVQERRQGPRRKIERRRQIDPTTCERDYSDEEIEFMRAMDEYKRKSGRQFPTWSEVLEVIRSLGYRQVAEQSDIQM